MSLESGRTTGKSKEADSGDVGVNRKETESKILELKKKTERSEKDRDYKSPTQRGEIMCFERYGER